MESSARKGAGSVRAREVVVDERMDTMERSQGFNMAAIVAMLSGHFCNHKSLSGSRAMGVNM